MYKLAVKFLLITLVLTGACLVLSSNGKALAATTSCPSGDSIPGDWGNDSDGEGSGVMSSLVMHARDASGNPLNPHFTLQSVAPGSSDDAQIYHWPIGSGGSVSNTDNWPQHGDFQFGTHLSGDGGVSCNGWIVLGPGIDGNVGNGWVLNCKTGGVDNKFWISHIDEPGGSLGQYGGRWEMYDAGTLIDSNVNSGSSPHIKFPVVNGSNKRYTFVWVANPGPTQTPEGSGRCTYFYETGSKYVRKEVHITGVSSGTGKSDWNGSTWTHSADFDEYTPAPVGSNVDPGTYTKEWWYRPTANIISVTVNEWDYDSASGTWPETTNSYNVSCYSANCSIDWVDGDGPWNGTYNPDGSPHYIVLASGTPGGGNMYVHGTFNNTSPAPDSLTMWAGAFLDGPNGANNLGFVPTAGNSYPFKITLSAPAYNPSAAYSTSFIPQYNASETNMSSCPMSVPVYAHFNINPSVSIDPNTNAEDPVTVSYTTHGQSTEGPTVTATTQGWLTKQPFGGAPGLVDGVHTTSDAYGTVDHTWTYNNSAINAGDQFCAYMTINPANGYRGPAGYPDANDNPASANSGCLKTVNKPYAHFFGSDVSAGGGFGQSCTATAAGSIYTYNEAPGGAVNSADKGGTGAQFGAEAFSVISGLGSANLRNSAPTGVSGLSFANTNVSGSPPAKITGGSLGGVGNFCVPDYFNDKPVSVAKDTATTSVSAGSGAAQQYYKPANTGTGTLTLNGGTINNGVNQVIFVEGNVNITGNITYSAAARASVKDIPSFYLVVKGGNIHIAPGVTQLDGVYVAQPDTTSAATIANTGIINTCQSSTAPVSGNGIYNSCKNQLVVNGAFVANKVLLSRSYSSLRYSQNGEHILGGYGAHNCGNAGKDVPTGAPNADCAAEIFNFSPELYMSQPGLNARFGASTDKYDAITSLPPVL